MNRWRLVGLSVILTSAFWLAVGAWLSICEPEEEVARAVHPFVRTSGTPLLASGTPVPGSVDSLLLIPVAGARADDLVDSFAQSQGIEIPAPPGMPVIAAAPGIVEKLTVGSAGRSVDVRSTDRTRLYRYGHLQAYAPGLSEGQVIGTGDQLGSAGSAPGKGVRLHFAVLAIMPDSDSLGGARPMNPYPLLGGGGKQSR